MGLRPILLGGSEGILPKEILEVQPCSNAIWCILEHLFEIQFVFIFRPYLSSIFLLLFFYYYYFNMMSAPQFLQGNPKEVREKRELARHVEKTADMAGLQGNLAVRRVFTAHFFFPPVSKLYLDWVAHSAPRLVSIGALYLEVMGLKASNTAVIKFRTFTTN